MIVKFESLEPPYIAKEVVFEKNVEFAEIIRVAREFLDEYNINFVRFEIKGSWYSFARV